MKLEVYKFVFGLTLRNRAGLKLKGNRTLPACLCAEPLAELRTCLQGLLGREMSRVIPSEVKILHICMHDLSKQSQDGASADLLGEGQLGPLNDRTNLASHSSHRQSKLKPPQSTIQSPILKC